LEYNFGDIKNMIDLNNMKIMYSQSESTIRYLKQVLTIYIEAPKTIQPMLKNQFLMGYENQYRDAGGNLFRGLMTNQMFSNNIIQTIRQHTSEDRAKTMQFMYSVSQILLQAMQLETTYNTLVDNNFYLATVKATWEKRISDLQDVIQKNRSRHCLKV